MRKLRHVLAFVLVAAMLLTCVPFASAAEKARVSAKQTKVDVSGIKKEPEAKFSKDALYQYDADEVVRAIVLLTGEAAADAGAVSATREAKILKQHTSFKSALKNAGISYTVNFEYTTLLNGLAISVRYGDLAAIEAIGGVKKVYIANTYDTPIVDKDTDTKQNQANTMSGADFMQSIGVKGEGMVVAILDTGLNLTHEAFQNTDIVEETLTEADVKAICPAAAYISAKIPYAYDYYGSTSGTIAPDDDVTDTQGHGTHVAGSVAGYVEAEDGAVTFSGVAPAAQLAIMKIFADNGGGTSSDIYFAALEDAYRLGVDVVNMSIGAQNGFTYDKELENEVFGNIYKKMDEAGIILSIAAGNEYSEGYENNLSHLTSVSGIVTADYADYGTVASPSTYGGNLSVAAVENVKYPSNAITIDGTNHSFVDSSTDGGFLKAFAGQELEFVLVPNVGETADYADIDVTGKVAVVSRGSINFGDKLKNAAAAGAIAMICYNNEEGVISMQIDEFPVPAISVQKVTGEALKACTSGKLTVVDGLTLIDNDKAWLMSDFSNYGTTGDLKFKPQITAVGGHVYSAVNTGDADYDVYSGTSMAAPNSSGNFALLLQALYEIYGKDECPSEGYTDLDVSKWYHEYVDYALANGLMGSTKADAKVFAPTMTMTRAQIVQVLYAAAGKPDVAFSGKFSDVAADAWYANAVEWAAEKGIVAGVGNGTFAPNASVTREQIATILYAAEGKPEVDTASLADYSDAGQVSGWAKNAVAWAVTKGIISGKASAGKTILAPKDAATRVEFAVIIMRYLNGSYKHSGLTKAEAAKMAEDVMESTATVLAGSDYVIYSPRKQGAGAIDLVNAIAADAYIVDPLIELGDDPERTGVYDMEFTVKSQSDKDAYYRIDAEWEVCDYAKDLASEDLGIYNFVDISDYAETPTYETNYTDNIVKVPAGGEATVKVKLTLNDKQRGYFETLFKNGSYVEGYVILWKQDYDAETGKFADAEDDSYIHASYLGFYGDWTDGSILEDTDFGDIVDYTYEIFQQAPQYLQAGYDWTYFYESNLGANEAYTYSMKDKKAYGYLGDNLFFYDGFDAAHIAISSGASTADGHYSDSFASQPMQLRNARHLIMTVTDAETGALYYVDDTEYLGKAYYDDDSGIYVPQGTFMWDATDADGNYVANGTKVHVRYYANLPYGEDALGAIAYEDLAAKGEDFLEWSYDVTVDTEGPKINAVLNEETQILTVTVSDNHYLSCVTVYDADSNKYLNVQPEQTKPGEEFTYEVDVSAADGLVMVDAYDYALNNNYETIDTGSAVAAEGFAWTAEDMDDFTGYMMLAGYDLVEEDGDTLYNNFYFLDASGSHVGADIAKNDAVVADSSVFDYSTDFDSNVGDYGGFINVPESLVYEVKKTEAGTYTFKMYGSDNYLTYGNDGKNSLTTSTDPTSAFAQWTISFDDNDLVHIVNAGDTNRILLYNTNNADTSDGSAGFFRCYKADSHYPGEQTDYSMFGLEIFFSPNYPLSDGE